MRRSEYLTLLGGARKPAALWTPLQLGASLDAWWDPSKTANITLNGGNIASYTDSSPHAVIASQATAGNQPGYSATGLNGLPAYIGGASKFLSAAGLLSSQLPFTVFAVMNASAPSTTGIILNSISNGGLELRVETTGVFSVFSTGITGYGSSTNASIIGTSAFALVVYDGTTLSFRVNGSAAGSAAQAISFSPSGSLLGSYTDGSLNFLGALGDIVKMNTAASLLQQQELEGFGAWKYGIQSVLPAGHPYKSAAPTAASIAAFGSNSNSILPLLAA
jgi:hypothetical protein